MQESSPNKLNLLADALGNALDRGALKQARDLLDTLSTAEIALLLEGSPPQERDLLWHLITPELEADILPRLHEEVQEQFLKSMDSSKLAHLTESMDVDDIADVLQQLPERLTQEVLDLMSLQDRQRVESILTYEEDTAGGLMDTDTITVRPDLTIDVVLRYLRRHDKIPEMTDSLFVVDRENHYLGRLFINDILTANPATLVEELLQQEQKAIEVTMAATDVAQLFEHNDWVSSAVIDTDNQLIGRITIDDAVDVIIEGSDRSMMGMAGLSEEEDTFAPVARSIMRRATWLGINLMTAFLATTVIGQFQDTIEKVVALAVLMPIVASMGGIAGTQTVTVVIRGLSLGHIQPKNLNWLLRREVILSIINAFLWALMSAGIAGWWFSDITIAWIIAIALTINLLAGATAGTFLPIIIKRMNIDPAIASGVILTTITDVVGFLSFLGLAQLFYG